MGVEIDADALEVELEEMSRDQAMEAAGRAFSSSQETLLEKGDDHEYEVYPIVQSGQPPEWDSTRDGAAFRYLHPVAYLLEVGTQTHEIVADDGVLAFEWEDAPAEVQEMFEESFPTVFFKSVEVAGLPAFHHVRGGLEDAARWLEEQ